jgi:hypothetical protein
MNFVPCSFVNNFRRSNHFCVGRSVSAIISRHDEINFHDGQVKFDPANPLENRRPIFPMEADAKQRVADQRYKTIPKKCQSSIAITIGGNFFWLMRKFQAHSRIITQIIEKFTE